MVSWTAVTVELRGEDDYYGETGDAVTEAFEQFASSEWGAVDTYTLQPGRPDDDGDPISFCVARFPGEVNEQTIVQRLHEASEMVTAAVVVWANDTSDTGTAAFFEPVDGDWTKTDSFEESQREHGYFVGELAAAQMFVRHGIPAVSLKRRHYDF